MRANEVMLWEIGVSYLHVAEGIRIQNGHSAVRTNHITVAPGILNDGLINVPQLFVGL